MKKTIYLFLTFLTLFATISCQSRNQSRRSSIEEQSNQKPKVVIGFIQNNVQIDSYQAAYDKTLREEVDKYPDVEFILLDSEGDEEIQASQVENMISQEVDVIVIWPTDGKKVIPAMRRAYLADIPVVITNSMVEEDGIQYMTAYSGPNSIQEGIYAAQLMSEALGGVGKIVQIAGVLGHTAFKERQQGFREELERIAPGITIVDTLQGSWSRKKTERLMENFLVKYPDIQGVYAADDNMGVGALEAALSLGKTNIVFVGSTNFAVGYDAIKEGTYYGSIYQSPVKDAKKAVEVALGIVKGTELKKYNYFETPKITRKNIDEFERPIF